MFKHSIYNQISVYDTGGTGDAVVFLHGLAAHAAYGEFLLNAFPGKRIFIPEFPGHGGSELPTEEIDVYQIALGLRAVLTHFGIEKPIICGHSLGGQVAILYAIIYPDDVRSEILISPAGLELFEDYQKQLIMNTLQLGSLFHNLFAPALKGTEIKELASLPSASIIRQYTQSMMDRPVKELLNRVQCPVSVLFGTNDPLIPNQMFNPGSPLRFAEKAVASHPNFHVIPLPGCGHWPMVENQALLVDAIKALK